MKLPTIVCQKGSYRKSTDNCIRKKRAGWDFCRGPVVAGVDDRTKVQPAQEPTGAIGSSMLWVCCNLAKLGTPPLGTKVPVLRWRIGWVAKYLTVTWGAFVPQLPLASRWTSTLGIAVALAPLLPHFFSAFRTFSPRKQVSCFCPFPSSLLSFSSASSSHSPHLSHRN